MRHSKLVHSRAQASPRTPLKGPSVGELVCGLWRGHDPAHMFAFSEHSNAWLPRLSGSRALLELEHLRVATYNVWFDPYESERRRRAVFEILEAEEVDVIALQEVTAPFLSALLSCPWVRAEYEISKLRFDASVRYDVVMLSRLPVRHFAAHALSSSMGRRLHLLTLDTQHGELLVAGSHLESMKEMTPTRLVQIGECEPILCAASAAVWMGDFNAAPGSDEDALLCTKFQDLWPLLANGEPGYTRDTSRNAMLARVKDDRHQRIDRILTRGAALRAESIRMVGTEPLAGADAVYPSDHFGLVADFTCSD
jgi:endonuclease/exonuclease/phosphatase family metal-dependent hydrolase